MHIKSILRPRSFLLKLSVAGLLALTFVSCKEKTKKSSPIIEETKPAEPPVYLSEQQKTLAALETGMIIKKHLSPSLECNGRLMLPPNAQASVTVPLQGFVKRIKVLPGEYVSQGQVIAILAHPEYISLQEEYLSIKSELDYLREEFKRQGELTVEKAASIKSFQKAQAEFLSREARFFSLKIQLQMLGINPDSVTHEKIREDVQLKAPISGNISMLNANLGKLVHPEEVIFEIINTDKLLLELDVYEKDISTIEPGQKIQFGLQQQPDKTFTATVMNSGQKVDAERRTIPVYAKLEITSPALKPGMFVVAHIAVATNNTWAIPETGVVRENQQSFIFLAKNDTTFIRKQVTTGISNGTYVELVTPDTLLLQSTIITRGAYYLNAEMSED